MQFSEPQNESQKSGRMAGPSVARLFSISPGTAFLSELVSALCAGKIIQGFVPADDPLILPDATIYVPNRRTARELAVAFLDFDGHGQAMLLPDIRTLGDVSDEEFGISPNLEDAANLPNPVGDLERKLELSTLVRKWVDALSTETRRLYGDEDIFIPSSQADAIHLSGDLCKLLDEITREESGWDKINKVMPAEHAQWWDLTSSFLRIVMEYWPKLLAERHQIDPANRTVTLLEKRITQYERNGSCGPVIVAGSTGSVPSTRRFLEVISSLPNGAVVLPGVDFSMDEDQWKALDTEKPSSSDAAQSHPQFGLAALLRSLGVVRQSVTPLGKIGSQIKTRSQVVSLALSLPEHTDQWKQELSSIPITSLNDALGKIGLIEASNERQEALAIALALRETLETGEKTAALVTPDRNLAQRVSIELRRFGIEVDDSAGTPFRNSQMGLFIRQLLQFCFGGGGNADIASLLKSSLAPIGYSINKARQFGEAFEENLLRGKVGRPVVGSLTAWVDHQNSIGKQQGGTDDNTETSEELKDYCRNLDEVLVGLAELAASQIPVRFGDYIAHFSVVLSRICADDEGNLVCASASGFAELMSLFEEVNATSASEFLIHPADLPSTFEAIIAPLTVRSKRQTHPRLHIYGPLEVRLLHYDRIVLGGLNEGTWPGATRNDAFLNRLMRQQLGMATPERSTGLAAHDFQQLMGKDEVILSRSRRVDKAPTIASRWVQRMLAVVGEDTSRAIRNRGSFYLEIAEALENTREKPKRGVRPCPVPPLESRPKSLPVTDIETWIRDPYALYAKRILGLRALPPLEREPDNLLKGTLYHGIMEDYVCLSRVDQSEAIRVSELRALARVHIKSQQLAPDVEVLWLMQFDEISERFVRWETEYFLENSVHQIRNEVQGGIELSQGEFYLHARADRVDVFKDGHLLVMDYKTGGSPSKPQARTLSPQLALEGVIARGGGFGEGEKAELEDLAFLRLRMGKDFSYDSIAQDKKRDLDLIELTDQARSNLEALVQEFRDPATGYISRRAPFKREIMDFDYDHLARTREWSFGEEGEDE